MVARWTIILLGLLSLGLQVSAQGACMSRCGTRTAGDESEDRWVSPFPDYPMRLPRTADRAWPRGRFEGHVNEIWDLQVIHNQAGWNDERINTIFHHTSPLTFPVWGGIGDVQYGYNPSVNTEFRFQTSVNNNLIAQHFQFREPHRTLHELIINFDIYQVDRRGRRLSDEPLPRRMISDTVEGERPELPAQYLYDATSEPRGRDLYHLGGTQSTFYAIPEEVRGANRLHLPENRRYIRVFWTAEIKWSANWVLHVPRVLH